MSEPHDLQEVKEDQQSLQEWRQHVDGVEASAKEGERRDDQQRDDLKLFESIRPQADDEPEQAEGD